MNNILKIDSLYKTYEKGDKAAINNVSLALQEGKIYVLMGSSGCGKSTLLNLIGTLDTPDSGEIFYKDKNYKSFHTTNQFRSNIIGFVFQFHHLIPILTLKENIETAMINIKQKNKEKKAKDLLERLGLKSQINSLANCVSGGERQRAAIARALANNPKLILADEPTGNVDTQTTHLILKELLKFNKNTQCTMLIATHDLEVAKIADVIFKMSDGKIVGEEIRNKDEKSITI